MTSERRVLVRESWQIHLQLEHLLNRRLAPADLTGAQALALLYIRGQPAGASATALYRTAHHSKATVSTLIRRLRDKGYVRAERCREDDRRRLLFLTDKGQQLQGFLEASFRDAENSLYRGFSAQELVQLEQLQRKMLQNLAASQVTSQKEASTT